MRVRSVAANPGIELKVEVEFTADTRAVYMMIPKAIAEKLELKELKRKFKLADSETIEYPASEYIAVESRGQQAQR